MPAYFWSCAGFSRKGERPNNEDNYFLDGSLLVEGEEDAAPRTAGLRSKGVVAVFDGMGGEQAGEYASFAAAELLRQKRSSPTCRKQTRNSAAGAKSCRPPWARPWPCSS